LQTGASSGTTKQGSFESMMMAYEREILIEAMKDARGNMSAAARALQATPRIVAYKLRQHDLHEVLAARRRD
jgi:Nif-specific regulatory protein